LEASVESIGTRRHKPRPPVLVKPWRLGRQSCVVSSPEMTILLAHFDKPRCKRSDHLGCFSGLPETRSAKPIGSNLLPCISWQNPSWNQRRQRF